jgi:hypothetical protein
MRRYISLKICPNCKEEHDGMFTDCYQCFDTETEAEYNARNKEVAKIYEVKKFRVSTNEIPDRITINISETEKCIFADLLTRYGIPVDVAGDTFQHLYRKGLEKMYQEEVQE